VGIHIFLNASPYNLWIRDGVGRGRQMENGLVAHGTGVHRLSGAVPITCVPGICHPTKNHSERIQSLIWPHGAIGPMPPGRKSGSASASTGRYPMVAGDSAASVAIQLKTSSGHEEAYLPISKRTAHRLYCAARPDLPREENPDGRVL
jgi:hypothetical protein